MSNQYYREKAVKEADEESDENSEESESLSIIDYDFEPCFNSSFNIESTIAHTQMHNGEKTLDNTRQEDKESINTDRNFNIVPRVEELELIKKPFKSKFCPKQINLDSSIRDRSLGRISKILASPNETRENLSFRVNKTAFTKVSEDLFKKHMTKGVFKIGSCYEVLTNEPYMNRVENKSNSKGNFKKIKSFLTRTKEYDIKKDLNVWSLQRDHLSCNSNTNLIQSNLKNRTFRSVEKFVDDQKTFLDHKENKLKILRERSISETVYNLKSYPSISLASQNIAKRKNKNTKEIHLRLYEEKLHKIKEKVIQVILEPKENEKKHISEQEVALIVERLFKDSHTTNKKLEISPNFRDLLRNKKNLTKEKLNNENNYVLTTDLTRKILIKKFVDKFNEQILNININKNDNVNKMFNFKNYYKLLSLLGFTTIDFESYNLNNFTNKSSDNERYLINESFKFLESRSNENEYVSKEEILLFFLSILGLYSGIVIEKPNLKEEDSYKIKLRKKQINNKIKSLKIEDPLLQDIIPNKNYEQVMVNQIKIKYRQFYDNRMNFLTKETKSKNKIYTSSNFTFKPNISTNFITERKRRSLYDLNPIIKKERLQKMRREAKEQAEMLECTFSPKLDSNKRFRPKSFDVHQRLYSTPKIEIVKKNSKEELKECTFSPKLTRMNTQIFKKQNFKEDKSWTKRLELLEKAKIEKMIVEVLKAKGYNSLHGLNNFKTLKVEYAKIKESPRIRFDNEKTSNKYSFDDYWKT